MSAKCNGKSAVLAIKNGGENMTIMTQQSWGYDVSSLAANVMG